MNKEKLIKSLENRGFSAKYFSTKEEAVSYLDDSIKDKTIGIGGSETVKEIGLDKVLEKDNKVFWHWDKSLVEKEGLKGARDLAAEADIYITSVNGVSEEGTLINIDGAGNRIASTAYGHEKVYFIIGRNKVEENFEKALFRARNVAAPKNAQRLKKKTPCAVKGDKCYDCKSPERICRGFMIIERAISSMKMEVVVIDEDLGM